MPVARGSEAVAFDMESMKPTPCETSSRRIGHVPFAVSISARAFAVARSSVACCATLRYSFHSATRASVEDLVVCELLDLRQLGIGEGVEVRDVEARHVRGLVRARLPDVVPEGLARGAEDNVRGRVIPHQRFATLAVDRARHPFPEEG